ncbi:50S ribosomal protein L23 [Candidatus Peregrinibacteria bacterium]|nr:50S ribosomal protein L23 [Candidatus Peregrinibacteria bacterium]
MQEKGKYTFLAKKKSTKIDIKNAIRKIYGVQIESVRMIPIKQKYRFLKKGQLMEKRDMLKKAIVTLKDKKKKLDLNKFLKEK